MNDLTLVLDDVTFLDLVERGRAVIPTAAPAWTDHNTHDPGIMLVELVAWIAEAQVYGLSRLRRDERLAYAALLGVPRFGPRPARGCLWPADLGKQGISGPTDPIVDPSHRLISGTPDAPAFFSTHPVRLWSARVTAVQSRPAEGPLRDWTAINRQEGATFRPFGGAPRRGDRFVLVLEQKGEAARAPSAGYVAVGFEVVRAAAPSPPDDDAESMPPLRRLRVSVVDARGEHPVRIEQDTTNGLLRSGVVLLAFDARSQPVGEDFEIVVQSARDGFLVPPRLQRVTLNALPVRQLELGRDDEKEFGTGLPDQEHRLAHPIVSPIDPTSIAVSTFEKGVQRTWQVVPDLHSYVASPPDAPAARIVELDAVAGVLRFGNGVNGMCVPFGATLRVEYPTCAGAEGNLPAGQVWNVAGTRYGNSAATAGGRDASSLDDLRVEARHRVRTRRPCVSRADLEGRALSFVDLGVTRAYEWTPTVPSPAMMPGARMLVVTGPHDPQGDDSDVTEPAEWLEEIARRLRPCMPLGQRLTVVAPRYVALRVAAKVVAAEGSDPAELMKDMEKVLRTQLAVVTTAPGDPVWPFGRKVSPVTVKGWLRRVDGVARIHSLQLWCDGRAAEKDVVLGPIGLPRLHCEPEDVTIVASARGGVR